MCSSILCLSLLVLGQADKSSPADRPERDLAAEVRRLVRKLDDAVLANRQAAEKALVELGPGALGSLPEITPRTPAEVKERLGRVRRALETAMAEAAAQRTYVTLSGEMPLSEAIQAIQEQTGNKVVGHQRRGGTVRVSFDKTPYWEALDKVLDQAGLTVNPYGGQPDALVVTARPDDELPRYGKAMYSGAFRFEATRIEARRDLRNPAVDGMRLTVSASWEPRVRPISLAQPLDQVEAFDNRGGRLRIDGSRGSLDASAETGITAVELGIPIELPDRGAEKIASFKAALTALIPGPVETFQFSDLDSSRDVQQRRAGVTVTFERMRKNLDLFEVRVGVRYDEAAGALESHRGWIYGNEAYVLDAGGQRIANAGLQATRQEINEVGLAYLFELPDGPAGCKFVYETPALILRLQVPYELKDIPLP